MRVSWSKMRGYGLFWLRPAQARLATHPIRFMAKSPAMLPIIGRVSKKADPLKILRSVA
jgi:hypothetical protein